MDDFTLILIVFFIVTAGAGLVILFLNLKNIREEIKDSREKNIDFLEKQIRESGRLIKDVTSELEKIHSDHQQVVELKTEVSKLTDVLANPKQRGILGEYFLETLLKNIFQPHQYQCQYKFKDGIVADAVIFVKEKIIPVDAKFSLENYNKIIEEKDSEKRQKLEKLFKNDLKTRIEETAKYIKPEEGTMDFAFMFIPSEGIYYDLLINQVGGIKSTTYDLIEYAFKEKHVIIVSPTSFYAYLQTVLQGLKALQIEKSTEKIIKRVETLQKHLVNYDTFFKKLGNHLGTTVNTYNKAYKEFGKIDKDVTKLIEKEKTVEPLQLDKPNHLE